MKFEIITTSLILLCLTYSTVSANLTLTTEETVNTSMTGSATSDVISYEHNFPKENFTIIVLPDTQHYSEKYPQIFLIAVF